MATLNTAFMTQKDTLVTIRFRPGGTSGMSWEGKEYGPGGEAAGFNGGDTLTLPAFWAARLIGNGRAELLSEEEAVAATPPGMFESRDPEHGKRGRRG